MGNSFTVLEQTKIFYGSLVSPADKQFNEWRINNYNKIHKINNVEIKMVHKSSYRHILFVYYTEPINDDLLNKNKGE